MVGLGMLVGALTMADWNTYSVRTSASALLQVSQGVCYQDTKGVESCFRRTGPNVNLPRSPRVR